MNGVPLGIRILLRNSRRKRSTENPGQVILLPPPRKKLPPVLGRIKRNAMIRHYVFYGIMDNSIHSTWKSESADFPRPANRVTHNFIRQPVIHITHNVHGNEINHFHTFIFLLRKRAKLQFLIGRFWHGCKRDWTDYRKYKRKNRTKNRLDKRIHTHEIVRNSNNLNLKDRK